MIKPECHLWGEKFSPSVLKEIENIQLMRVNEPCEIGSTGRYKGVPLPYGACTICTPKTIPIPDRISWMADFIREHKSKFIEAGARDITFWICWYGIQGNMEFSPSELNKIAKLNIHLCINYIQEDPFD